MVEEKILDWCRTCEARIDLKTIVRLLQYKQSLRVVETRDGRCHSLTIGPVAVEDKETQDGPRTQEAEGSGQAEPEIAATETAKVESSGAENTEGELENGN